MPSVHVVTDSTADVPPRIAASLGITVIPDEVIFGQRSYRDGVDITLQQFLSRLATDPHLPQTAQPSLGTFLQVYRHLNQNAAGIVSIHVGHHLSGMVGTAQAAAAELASEVPVAVIDSQQLSMGQGWQVIAAAQAVRLGYAFEEVVSLARRLPATARVAAMLDSLEHVRRGGRIGRVTALVGDALRVKPLIGVTGGQPVVLGNVRTQGKALARLADLVAADVPFGAVAVLHTGAPAAAEQLADLLGAFFPRQQILLAETGATVATHLGPGAVGCCLMLAADREIDARLFRWWELESG